MGESEALRYAVILTKTEHFQAAKIAEALARARKIPMADTAPEARRSWGIAADNLDKSQAEALAARLKDLGLEGLVIPRALIEELPGAEQAVKAELGDEKLRVTLRAGKEHWVAWTSIGLISALGFKEITSTTIKVKEGPDLGQKALSLGLKLATGLPINIGGGERIVERTKETSDLAFYLELYCREPALRLRVDAENFDYSCLKAMAYNTVSNFRILLGELARRAPAALRNKGASIFLDGKPIANMGYDSLADMERESRWLLTLKSLNKV